jgi:hypothetical protein
VKLNYGDDFDHSELRTDIERETSVPSNMEYNAPGELSGPKRQYKGVRDVIKAARKEVGGLIPFDGEFPALTPTPPLASVANNPNRSLNITSPRAAKAIARKTIPESNDFVSYTLNYGQDSQTEVIVETFVPQVHRSVAKEFFSGRREIGNLSVKHSDSEFNKGNYSIINEIHYQRPQK